MVHEVWECDRCHEQFWQKSRPEGWVVLEVTYFEGTHDRVAKHDLCAACVALIITETPKKIRVIKQ